MVENKNIQTPSQSIKKSYLRQPVDQAELENFREYLEILLKELNPSDIEEANKGRVKTFLEHTLWLSNSYEINASGKTDLTIKDKNLERNVVLFEFKKVNSPEMVTKEDLVRKAMFELVLYYVLEEHERKNTNIKHLVISDGYKYFIFEKGLFWDLFGRDKMLVRNIMSSERTSSEKRDYIYNQIIKPKVEAYKNKLAFTYVDLASYCKEIDKKNIISKPRFKALFKLFSPIHLQNLPFSEDHNTLNKKFYSELLYIMGLEERGQKHQIQRLRGENRQGYSLLEQAYSMLADYELTDNTKGYQNENLRFETALGLVIVWINRTLFMKLLESQLIAFNGNKKKYAFFEKLTDFSMMHYLFCKVMAIPELERTDEMKNKFGEVPYLNSSLFELTDIEKSYFPISSLRNGEVEIMKNTCLKDKRGKEASGRIRILDYLKQFLDSYDFGAEAGESGKTIINASVLGLIFEKINGYKDGSFFTPGYITSYLCHETLRRCVTDRYNEKYGTDYKDFETLAENFDYTDKNKRDGVNAMINGIRVCDPAVGSGHFVVSALNEFIAIKRELNVLKTIDGKRFGYRVDIEDDELVVTDADGELRYNPNDAESQLVQETLFEEKRTIIENCLFGVDINPNSAEICQLRLWIELLKNAYYIKDDAGKRHLQTLPNIDINIKCGNSLVMKYALGDPIDKVLRGAKVTMSEYRRHVADYKNCPSKENKHTVEQDIAKIKSKLDEGYDKETDEYKKWVKVCADILSRDNSLFPPEEEETKVLENLRKQEVKLRHAVEEVSNRHARLKAFEWRYEFPEVLDDKGFFKGFDCIIGNPPYGVSIQDEYRKTVEEKHEHMPDYEIYYYFISLGQKLLKNKGYLAYIIPNTWLFNQFAQSLRENLVQVDIEHPYAWSIEQLLDCTNIPIFDSATVRNTVIIMQKSNKPSADITYKNTRDLIENQDDNKLEGKSLFNKLINRESLTISIEDLKKEFSQNWGLAFFLTKEENQVVGNIMSNTVALETLFTEVSQGIIAYDKLKGVSKKDIENRAFHSETYHSGYKKWLRGFDVNKYSVAWNTSPVKVSGKQTDKEIYVDYDRIPKAREQKYFMGKRLLVREITNPSIFAAITDEELYNDPAILVVKDSDRYPLELVCGILNSQLAAFYHFRHSPKATKGAFPKIMISDIRKFPLPRISGDNSNIAEKIIRLVGKIQSKNQTGDSKNDMIQGLQWQIDYWVFKFYNIGEKDILTIDESFFDRKPADFILSDGE